LSKSSEEVIRKLSAEYLLLRNAFQNLQRKAELLNRILSDIDNTLASLENIKNLKEEHSIIFSLGSSVYVKGKITSFDRILVDVGSGVVMEKSIDDAIEYLRERQRDLQLELRTTLIQIRQISSRMEEIENILGEGMRVSK